MQVLHSPVRAVTWLIANRFGSTHIRKPEEKKSQSNKQTNKHLCNPTLCPLCNRFWAHKRHNSYPCFLATTSAVHSHHTNPVTCAHPRGWCLQEGGSVYSLAVSPDYIIAGTFENLIHVWNKDYEKVESLQGTLRPTMAFVRVYIYSRLADKDMYTHAHTRVRAHGFSSPPPQIFNPPLTLSPCLCTTLLPVLYNAAQGTSGRCTGSWCFVMDKTKAASSPPHTTAP